MKRPLVRPPSAVDAGLYVCIETQIRGSCTHDEFCLSEILLAAPTGEGEQRQVVT